MNQGSIIQLFTYRCRIRFNVNFIVIRGFLISNYRYLEHHGYFEISDGKVTKKSDVLGEINSLSKTSQMWEPNVRVRKVVERDDVSKRKSYIFIDIQWDICRIRSVQWYPLCVTAIETCPLNSRGEWKCVFLISSVYPSTGAFEVRFVWTQWNCMSKIKIFSLSRNDRLTRRDCLLFTQWLVNNFTLIWQ